jgi:hypothetical protein
MKTSIKILIAAIIVAVLGIGTAAALILTADPYKKAETAYVTELMPFSKNVKYLDGYTGSYDVTYEMSQDLIDELGEDIGLVSVWGDFDALTSKQRISAYLTSGEDTIGGEAFVDTSMVYLTMPEITDFVMTAEIEGPEDLPEIDTADLLKTGTAVSDLYFDMAKEYGTYGDGEFTNGGETFKCETFTIDFTGTMMSDFLTASVDEIKKNENIMDYMQAYGDLTEMDFEEELDYFIEDAQYKLEEIGDDTAVTMTVFIKGGKIIGRELFNFYNDENILIQLYDTEKGSARNQLIKISDEDDKIEYKGDFEKSGGKYSGTARFTATAYGEETVSMKADVSGFEYYPEGGFADGDINIEMETYGQVVWVDISMYKDGNTQNAGMSMGFESDYVNAELGTITMALTIDPKNPTIDAPSFDEANAIDLNDPDYDKTEAFIEDILVYQDSLDHDGIIYQMIESMMYNFGYYY